eukprot:TRINITY_DN33352_c0_g1_i1.p1 TRINITY_DN33352_c0_g1~~TRINITY_DN33352_c0_g1_i1.p1  ORF type:complete len:249 (-),score=29.53 TRINITY_DN33352_c0_g1_i1:30-776(-)
MASVEATTSEEVESVSTQADLLRGRGDFRLRSMGFAIPNPPKVSAGFDGRPCLSSRPGLLLISDDCFTLEPLSPVTPRSEQSRCSFGSSTSSGSSTPRWSSTTPVPPAPPPSPSAAAVLAIAKAAAEQSVAQTPRQGNTQRGNGDATLISLRKICAAVVALQATQRRSGSCMPSPLRPQKPSQPMPSTSFSAWRKTRVALSEASTNSSTREPSWNSRQVEAIRCSRTCSVPASRRLPRKLPALGSQTP